LLLLLLLPTTQQPLLPPPLPLWRLLLLVLLVVVSRAVVSPKISADAAPSSPSHVRIAQPTTLGSMPLRASVCTSQARPVLLPALDGRGELSSLSLWWRRRRLLLLLLRFFVLFDDRRAQSSSLSSLLHSSDVGSSDMSSNCPLRLRFSLFLVVARMAFCISPRSCFFPIFLCLRKSLNRSDLRSN